MPFEGKGRNQGDVSMSLGMPNIAKNLPETMRQEQNRFFLRIFKRKQPYWQFTLDL